jgi:hypothetical protein
MSSARRRAARRAAERAAAPRAEEGAAAGPVLASGGRGDEPHLTPQQSNAVHGLMVRADRTVWPISADHERAAVAVTVRNMASDDGRVSNGAVKNLIAMQSQILRRDEIERGVGAGASSAVNIANIQNNGPTVIQLVPQVVTTHAEAVAVLSEATGLPPE